MPKFSRRTYKPECPLVRTRHFEVGEFHALASTPNFEEIASPFDRPHFVLPSSPVVIEADSGRSFLADRASALVYPAGLTYRRFPLSAEGDHCLWAAPTKPLLTSETQLARACQELLARTVEPFRIRIPNELFLELRLLQQWLIKGVPVRKLNERFLEICNWIVDQRHNSCETVLGYRIEEVLSEKYTEKSPLACIAQSLGVSAEHVCRVFRKSAGITVHQQVVRLRTRAAVERILEGERSLTSIAMDVGFSSHSHLTCAINKEFGVTPSQIRRLIMTDPCKHRVPRA